MTHFKRRFCLAFLKLNLRNINSRICQSDRIGEQGRMLFGKLILQKNNIMVMDEPTNHLDMESIEPLNTALES